MNISDLSKYTRKQIYPELICQSEFFKCVSVYWNDLCMILNFFQILKNKSLECVLCIRNRYFTFLGHMPRHVWDGMNESKLYQWFILTNVLLTLLVYTATEKLPLECMFLYKSTRLLETYFHRMSVAFSPENVLVLSLINV